MDSAKLKFTRVRLQNWKNFASADVPLRDAMFLVGPNASGKSNFLDAFRFLAELVSTGGGLQAAVKKRSGVSAIRCLAARSNPAIGILVEMAGDGVHWSYELAFTSAKTKRSQLPKVVHEEVTKNGKVLFRRPGDEDIADPERLSQTYLEQVNENKDYREIATFFKSIRYLHLVPQLVREPDRSVGMKDDPYGGTFIEQVASTSKGIRERQLKRINAALRVAVPQLENLSLVQDEKTGTHHLEGHYRHWRGQPQRQWESQFSDGTLRLIGLLWSLLDGSGPLLLEEPELSLHDELVKQLPALFYRLRRRTGRQILISTHSESMIRSEAIAADEVLLIVPSSDGSSVQLASNNASVRKALDASDDLAVAVRPFTTPPEVQQLSLFVG